MSKLLKLEHGSIELIHGNIVDQQVDAIVNAANTKLKGGGGVDGAIHRAAGSKLLEECLNLPLDDRGQRCPTGAARITHAGNLKAKWVIHAVGPFFNDKYYDKSVDLLEKVYTNALDLANTYNCESIALPAISTGAYRFPLDMAAEISLRTASKFLIDRTNLNDIKFILYKPRTLAVFEEKLLNMATEYGLKI